MFANKYHLPHNAIRLDEVQHMLHCIDLSRDCYLYEELRLLFLQCQIKDDVLKTFHPAYDKNLSNHKIASIREIYNECKSNPTNENLVKLLNVQYTDKKTFKQVFNETIRDYTEFFAFLGLLPTYYKGKSGGDKAHYITSLLKDYIDNKTTFESILLDFKYRNTSKDFDVLDMYHISVRPFVVALKALDYFFKKGFGSVNNKILSAIVLYSKDENVEHICEMFNNPQLNIDEYSNLFEGNFESIRDELGRATLFLKPYLVDMGYVKYEKSAYIKGEKDICSLKVCNKALFCNSVIGNIMLTPVVGKIIFKLNVLSKHNIKFVNEEDLFDVNIAYEDREYLINELISLGLIVKENGKILISSYSNQLAINPYTDFFDYEEARYVANVGTLIVNQDNFIIKNKNIELETKLNNIRPIALGSNGPLYEESMYQIIHDYLKAFNTTWYGAASTGKRLSDIYIKVNILDGMQKKKIAIIIECKAGHAVRAFDERKEIDDILNTLARENEKLDGIWYWVVNGDSLPSVDEHGGYRSNNLSKSFVEKLNNIQFDLSEYMRVPTIVTAFSFDAIKNYLSYLYDKIGDSENLVLNRTIVPHFWRWSKSFMNLQYVMVHKELRLGA